MNKKKKNKHILLIIACLFIQGSLFAVPSKQKTDIPELTNLNPQTNSELKALREDVRKTISTVKGKQSADKMPKLRFYKYRMKSDDTFWTVMTASSLDIDTIMTINDLSSPGLAKPGKVLYLANMRGIILENKTGKELGKLLREKKISSEYVTAVNGKLDQKYLFVPCGEISSIQRSLFLGTGFTLPLLEGRQTSGFGTRRNPFDSRRSEFHKGIDIACPQGSKVLAARDGVVTFTGIQGGYGKLIILNHEHGYSSYYGHLSKYNVKPGQKVSRGDVIGFSGNTGRTTGPHLHFEVKKGNRSFNPGLLVK